MSSLYQHKLNNPFHISVGAVVVNEEGKILVHKMAQKDVPADVAEAFNYSMIANEELYLLMRETLEDGETLEEAVIRGVAEEFGVEGKVIKYLGSIVSKAFARENEFEKTTLYFQVELIQQNERPEDPESFSILEWHKPEFLIEKMKSQRNEKRTDLDESKIIEAYVKFS